MNIFKEQIKLFKKFLAEAGPTKEQSSDIDYLLALGEILTLVAYGQLIIESRKFFPVEDDLLDEIFDFMVRDFSKFALNIHMKPSNSDKQKELSLAIIRTPHPQPGAVRQDIQGAGLLAEGYVQDEGSELTESADSHPRLTRIIA